jgi:hypothetical protein
MRFNRTQLLQYPVLDQFECRATNHKAPSMAHRAAAGVVGRRAEKYSGGYGWELIDYLARACDANGMERRLKRPRDPIARAKLIGDIATGQTEDKTDNGKNPSAVDLGRLGGLKGGMSRARKLSAEERRKIAEKTAERALEKGLIKNRTCDSLALNASHNYKWLH